MKKIKVIGYGGAQERDILKYLSEKEFDFIEFVYDSYDIDDAENVFVIANFRKITELTDFLLKNSAKIRKVYELYPFAFEGAEREENSENAYKALTENGIDVERIQLNELLENCSKDTTIKQSFSVISKRIFDDISEPLEIAGKEFVDDIAEHMLEYTKDCAVTEFTVSKKIMSLSDRYGMTPTMYFALYGRNFDTSVLNDEDKKDILAKKNIFGHNIIDIASLSRFEQYMDMRMVFDFDFAAKEKEYLESLNKMKLDATRLESKTKEPTVVSFFRKLFTSNKASDNQIQLQVLKNKINAIEEKHNADLRYEYNEKKQNVILDIEEIDGNADTQPILELYHRKIKLAERLGI